MAGKKSIMTPLILAVLSVLFLLLLKTVDVAAVGPNGTSVGLSSMNKAFSELVGVNMLLYKITQVIGILTFVVCGIFGCLGIVQLVKRKSIAKVDKCLLMLGGLYVIILGVYAFFEKVIVNYRPVIMEGEITPEASFPSSHTMMACAVFGSAAMVLSRYIQNETKLALLRIICFVIIAVMVIGRMLSGVHWLSDIIGGVLISAFLLSVFGNLLYAKEEKN